MSQVRQQQRLEAYKCNYQQSFTPSEPPGGPTPPLARLSLLTTLIGALDIHTCSNDIKSGHYIENE